ncbi:MAG: hypothetical protein HYR77_06330 [Ignavibacteria bacterium]|nr:hypothetical protein [Ignavibacteria bacterium]
MEVITVMIPSSVGEFERVQIAGSIVRLNEEIIGVNVVDENGEGSYFEFGGSSEDEQQN